MVFLSVGASAEGKKSNLTAITAGRGEVMQTHSHGNFGYSKHGQGNGAVAQMNGNKDKEETNGWALDTSQVAGVQQISWLGRVFTQI